MIQMIGKPVDLQSSRERMEYKLIERKGTYKLWYYGMIQDDG
jgi:hypothetical protein